MDLKYTAADYHKANIKRVNVAFTKTTNTWLGLVTDTVKEYHYYLNIDELKEELTNYCLFKGYDSFEILLPSNIPY